ncbi:MAG TPA: rod shape-determining protein MreD [Candidatus Dormibacteraeota bacterium]|nr:rod shape-determining protein MreD [Candidatus Dormibacteraeota bacterium]
MRRVAGLGLMSAAALAQATWAPRFEVGGAFPNLVLAAVVGLSWTLGTRSALVWAVAGGLLLDLTSSGPIGPHALALLPGVYVSGFWIRNLEHPNAVHVALTAAVCTVLYSAVLVLADDLLGTALPAPGAAVQLTIAAAIYNAVLAPFAYELVRRLQSLVRAAPQTS